MSMYCMNCGEALPDGADRCPSCGARVQGREGEAGRRSGAHPAGKSEGVAIVASVLVPGAGLVYLGDRGAGLTMFGLSVVLLVLLVITSGYAGGGSVGIRVDSVPGFVVLAAMVVVWLYSNYRARKLWEEQTGDAPLL